MQKIKEIYKIGAGPSSSHTLAPQRAVRLFIEEFGKLDSYYIELYGSLSLTGKGHWTDVVIKETLNFTDNVEVAFKLNWDEEFENGFYIYGYKNNNLVAKWTVFSIGGGSIEIKEKDLDFNDEVYIEKNFKEIKEYVKSNNISLVDYVLNKEPDIKEYMSTIFDAIIKSVENGLSKEGYLPGSLKVKKVAKELYNEAITNNDNALRMMSYAYAASEENASRGQVVTSPTLGACGIIASEVYHQFKDKNISKDKLIEGLIVAGIFGNVIKKNASISGAIGGCQAEVGTATSMCAALLAYIDDLDIDVIEYAAEVGIEHNLGLTCDPVEGYVIIPCVERNAIGVLRAYESYRLSKNVSKLKKNMISFDMIVNVMNYTGKQIPIELKETSIGGLAREYEEN